MTKSSQVWLVTGAGRGLGRCIAEEILRRGHRVLATGRDAAAIAETLRAAASYPDQLATVPLDLDDTAGPQQAVDAAMEAFGRLDNVVNNAGYGLLGAVEEVDDEEMEAVFRTNVFGTQRMIRAALPLLRRSGRGCIVNISSLGGFAASGGWGIYNATKFALEGMSEALALELAPLGIRVLIVEPGSFRTGFLGERSMRRARCSLDIYAATAGTTRQVVLQRAGRQIGDPALAASAIVTVASSPNPPLRLVLGRDALNRIEGKLASVGEELQAWKHLSSATDFTS
jgi:NAD(P)-dependent dehydrogenase (short-subunit alcohol dehydrogenase family)